MKKYRKSRKIYLIILIIIISLIVIFFTNYSLRNDRDITTLEGGVKDITIFIGKTIYAPIKFIKDKVEIYTDKEDIYKKYNELEKEHSSIEQYKAQIKELEIENEGLRKLLELDEGLSQYKQINANVINRNVGYWYDKLTIDKGKKEDIDNNMAVVTEKGLVGYIAESSNFSSTVQLLTTKNLKNKISIKIELEDNKYANGLLIGYNKEKKVYIIEGVSYYGEIPKGAVVTTTGLSEKFPSGILVGYVNNITTDNFDLGKIIEVTPSVDFDNLGFVSVLKREAKTNDNN